MTGAPVRLVVIPLLVCGCLGPEPRQPAASPGTSSTRTADPRTEPAEPPLAAEAASQPIAALTLPRALELADRLHPAIAQAAAELEAAGGKSQQAGVFANPLAVARMESAPIDGRTAEEAEYVAGISQRIPLGRRLSTASRAARLEEERLRLELAAKRAGIHRCVRGAFATALFLEEIVEVQGEAVRIGENGVGSASARLAAGDALPEDVARAEIELERARLDLELARSLRDQARAELVAAMGDGSLGIVALEGSLETVLELPALESLSARLDEHPSLLAAEAEISSQRARVDLAQVQRIPDVNLDLFYRRLELTDTNAFDVGLAIPIPLFDRNRGSVREAQAGVAAAEARARSTRNELEREMRQAHTRLASALEDARVLRDVIVPRAAMVLRAFEGRYAAGDASLTELIPARRERIAVELMRLESLRDVMEAWATLSAYLPRPSGTPAVPEAAGGATHASATNSATRANGI